MTLRGIPPPDSGLEAYRKAGKIASIVRRRIVDLVKPGEKILQICEEAEEMIRRQGGQPAFPTNVSVGYITAHYTSPPGDQTKLPEEGLVKVDLGVSIDGYLSDTATTVDLGCKDVVMVNAAEKALETAISVIRAGTNVGSVGKAVGNVIREAGLKPISNLTGHSLGRNDLHSGIPVPNIPVHLGHTMMEGEVYAIEPFVTEKDGKGFVKEAKSAFIFSCIVDSLAIDRGAAPEMELLADLKGKFGRLPFAIRWLDRDPDLKQLGRLLKRGLLAEYPVLVEAGKKPVAQAEHTVLVGRRDCEVLTS